MQTFARERGLPSLRLDVPSEGVVVMRSVAIDVVARALSGLLLLTALAAPALAQRADGDTYRPEVGQAGKDVVWVPTPDEVVTKMLDMAQLQRGERVVDLGSGDGKIAIAAAQRGAIARGIEFNPKLVTLARQKAEEAGVKVDFAQGDIFESNFRNADVVTLYLLPSLNERLRPILLRMKPGTRVTSHQFPMGDWTPDQTATVGSRQAHLWIVPAQVDGRWQLQFDDGSPPVALTLRQRFQMVSGGARWNGRDAELSQARVKGAQVEFTVADGDGTAHRFEALAEKPDRLRGHAVAGDGRRLAFTATR
jgi:SAM-dependent methyltransferase